MPVVSRAKKAGRQRRPAGRLLASIIVARLALGFGEDREAVRDRINRIVGSAIGLVARLTDAPGDADKIADCGVGEPVAQ